jgi:tRNA dimethylallyltransferase
MKPLIAIVGPTALAKSKLALKLAQSFDGEIVSADSQQVYRYMDIGTAKPSLEERGLVPHHLIDVVDPDDDFSLALFHKLANQALEAISRGGETPFLVGGSGLYIWSLLEGWSLPQVPPHPEFRRSLQARAQAEGSAALYEELQGLDPVAAERIDPKNIRRVIRALEVYRATGKPFSQLQQRQPPPFQILVIGLTAERAELYRRIDSRVDDMIKRGLVDEVKGLLSRGYSLSLPSMSGLGYKQIGMSLQGELELSIAIQNIKHETHRFARHQYAWFRLSDERIHWFDIKQEHEEPTKELIMRFMERSNSP